MSPVYEQQNGLQEVVLKVWLHDQILPQISYKLRVNFESSDRKPLLRSMSHHETWQERYWEFKMMIDEKLMKFPRPEEICW